MAETSQIQQDHGAASAARIVLTGFMGTGKSTVGKLVATELGYDFVDTDVLIESRYGPIPDIFREHGEAYFRKVEHEIAAELVDRSAIVVATGGRMMLDPANVATLGADSRIFCLVATADEILKRVLGDESPIERPLLAGPNPRQRVVDLLAERSPHYQQFFQVTTSNRSAHDVASEIVSLVTASPST